MLGRRGIKALEARLSLLEARSTVIEVLYGAIAGLALRAAPEEARAQILKDLRSSVTGGAAGSGLESEVLLIEELVEQIIDQIEGIARGKA